MSFYLARVRQCITGLVDQGIDLAQQALCRDCSPVGSAHVLGNVVNNLSLTLPGNQITIRMLLGTNIGETKVEDIPGEGNILSITLTTL